MGKVRVGIIGAGSWAASNHIPVLKDRDDVELVVACRQGNEELALLKEQFGFEHVTENYQDALGHELDAVIVASPSGFHFEHAKAALESGANVLCEKPFTIDPGHAWELDALAKSLNRELILSFGWNYRPLVISAKNLMEEHGVGKIQHVMVAMGSGTRELLKATGDYEGAAADFRCQRLTCLPGTGACATAPALALHGDHTKTVATATANRSAHHP